MNVTPLDQHAEQKKGIYYALSAFIMWGLVPVYFKAVDHVTATEVLAHRVVWSVGFLAIFITFTGRLKDILGFLKRPKIVTGLALSAAVISLNWLTFIWAVGQERIVEATLGYFINPLISIVFGMIFFSERMRLAQWVAVMIAALGVIYQIVLLGELPWVALTLAFSFATYGALRKKIPVDSISGLFIETLWLLPLSAGFMIWLIVKQEFQFITEGNETMLILMCAGLVTSLPLLSFASAARRLSLTLVGLHEYIGPSIAFLIAVFYYGEPMDQQRLLSFVIIWIALGLFSIEGLLFQRKKRITQSYSAEPN